jgi:hypothetical protein
MGYEIWGALVMLTYDNEVRKMKMWNENMGISFKNPQISYPKDMSCKVMVFSI